MQKHCIADTVPCVPLKRHTLQCQVQVRLCCGLGKIYRCLGGISHVKDQYFSMVVTQKERNDSVVRVIVKKKKKKKKNVTTSIVSYEEAYCPLFLSFSTSCSFLLWKSAKTECLVLSCSSESSATLWSSGGHCVLVAPCHVWAIFTLWFTFRKDNHVGNICRQLLDYTICSTSNLIFFFIYIL